MSELGRRVAFGAETKRGNIIPCESGHPVYVAIADIDPDDESTWGWKIVRCDGGEQPAIGGSEGKWGKCVRCGALLARTAYHGGSGLPRS